MYKKSLAYPHLLWMLVFVLVPIAIILLYSINIFASGGEAGFSLANYKKLFSDTLYLKTFAYSLGIAFLSTLFCILLGYPVSYIISKREKERQRKGKKSSTMFMLFVMPMWMNMMLRTYSWLTILEDNGLLNAVLGFFHLPEVHILYTSYAVVLGMVYNYIPYMILPLYSIMSKIDHGLIEAAEDLGANKLTVLRKVIIPLSLPGVASGFTMVFVPSVSTFYISKKLGGNAFALIGDVIEMQFKSSNNYNLGAALSLVLMFMIIICMAVMNRFTGDDDDGGVLI